MNFDLHEGSYFYAGHDDANRPFSSSYYNNCRVKYVKYFPNAICTDDEIKKFADCSDDKCA